MINVLVVDDESLANRRLEIKLSRYEDITVVGSAKDGDEAIEKIKSLEPELVFLDINMPGADGLEVASIAQQLSVQVIFVTAFNQFAVQAFEQQAVDYLLKPVSTNRLDQALTKFRNLRKQADAIDKVAELYSVVAQIRSTDINSSSIPKNDKIWIKDRGRVQKISANQIEWIEASRDYVKLHMIDQKSHFVRDTMMHFEELLDKSVFQRVHRSAIVNFMQIEQVSKNNGATQLHLRSGAEIPVGRSYSSKSNIKLKEIFNNAGM